MLAGLRLVRLAGTACLLVGLPMGDASVLFALVLALDLAVMAAVLRRIRAHAQASPHPAAAASVVAAWVGRIGVGHGTVQLMRRTVPGLRMRRPAGIAAAQARWRHAAVLREHRRKAS